MDRLVDNIYTFKGKVEDVENDYIINVQEKLKAYEDKQEQGLLISLPCKVGDTVYQLLLTGIKNHELEYGIFEAKVTRFIQDSFYLCVEMVATDESKRILELTTGAFGKTVFFTEAEAEEALAKMGGK